jgi:hypothetical protein
MFRAPTEFVLSSTSGIKNGSMLIFTLFADHDATSTGRIYISTYPKQSNSNILTYGYDDGIPSLLSIDDVSRWKRTERSNIQVNNFYAINPFTYNALGYKFLHHQ